MVKSIKNKRNHKYYTTNNKSKKKQSHSKNKNKVKKTNKQFGGAYYLDNQEELKGIFAKFMQKDQIIKRTLERDGLTTQDFYKHPDIEKKTDDDYLNNVKEGLDSYLDDPRPYVFNFLSYHGKYFDPEIFKGTLNYFVVPSNIIICVLTPPDMYSVSYRIKQAYYMLQDKIFDAMIKYRGKLKDETFFYEKNKTFNCELTDYFKFSNWFYPGQLCNNFILNLSEQEFHERRRENFDIYQLASKKMTYGRQVTENIYRRFYKPQRGIAIRADKLFSCYQQDSKYIVMVESCNMTNVNLHSKSSQVAENLYQMHHLNQWVIQTIEKEKNTPLPLIDETYNFKYQGIRTPLHSLYRHTKGDKFDRSAGSRLVAVIDQEGSLLTYPVKNYKVELYYEIIDKLGGSYNDVTDMQEYFKFLENLSMTEMLQFIKLLGTHKDKYPHQNLLFLLSQVFGKNNFIVDFNQKVIQIFQVFRAMNNIEGSQEIESLEHKKKQLEILMSNFVKQGLNIQTFLNEQYGAEARTTPDLTSIKGILEVLNADDAHKYKYIISQVKVGSPAVQLRPRVDHSLVSTLLFSNTNQLPPNIPDITKYKFDYLEIQNSDMSNFDDTKYQYDLEYLQRRKLDVLVQDSFFQTNPKFSLLGHARILFILKSRDKQKKIRIGHLLHNLETLNIDVTPHLNLVDIENNNVETAVIMSGSAQETVPTIRLRALNLKSLNLKGVSTQKLFLHSCRNLHKLEFNSLTLHRDRMEQISKYIPVLKKLIIKECKVINTAESKPLSIPPRLEEIIIHNLQDGMIDFSKTELREVKHMSILKAKLDIEGIFSSKAKFSKEKLEYLYVILDNDTKLSGDEKKKFYDLDDYLISIGSRIADRTINDMEYEKFFR